MPACVDVYNVCASGLQRAKEGIRFPKTGV